MPLAEIDLGLDLFQHTSEPGRPAAFLVLLAFLLSFLFIRTSARMIRAQVSWWPGNVETSGGLHIHHLVWGISLLLVSGFVAFASDLESPWWQVTSIAFGIGAGLTLDEFALWVRLEDVYWSEQGRESIDAVIVAATLAGLVVLGLRPLGYDDAGSVLATVFAALVVLGFAAVTIMKGRVWLGVVGLFVPLVGLWGALRLAEPGSPWAHKRYDEEQLERARARFDPDRRSARVREKALDAVAGAPSRDRSGRDKVEDA